MRKRRDIVLGANYHVIARANRQEFILNSDKMKEMMLEIIKRAKKKYQFQIKNFCIMSNHIHLLIRPSSGENLSRIMQWILSVFAVCYNRIYGHHGHVWYDRFKSKVVESFRQFLRVFQYIMDNPVRAGIVKNSIDYPCSGINYIRNKNFDLLELPDLSVSLCLSLLFDQLYLPDNRADVAEGT
jgi:putative transposase